MKNVVVVLFVLFAVTACGSSGSKGTEAAKAENTAVTTADASVVNVYYFHGKQRCKTCIAVGDVSQKTIETAYAGNNKVRFVDVNTSEKANEKLVEKYQITWNALIIAKGDKSVDLTEQAFTTAINSPEKLETLIKETVNKYQL